jgi:hypothetical protein
MTTDLDHASTREHVSTYDDRVSIHDVGDAALEQRDRVRWGPVWAGLVTAVAAFALLQLTFFATDAVSLDVNPSGDAETALPFWSGLAAGVGFFLGGLVTGASTRWRRISDGVLQGVVLWALTTLALILVSGVAAGSLTSSLGGTFGRLADLRTELADSGTLTDDQVNDARDAAAAAVLLLGIMFGATVLGAIVGTKLWPRARRRHTDDVVEVRREDRPLPPAAPTQTSEAVHEHSDHGGRVTHDVH